MVIAEGSSKSLRGCMKLEPFLPTTSTPLVRSCIFPTFCFSLELLRRVNVPTIVYSASLLLTNKIFICGGEDFKLYKYNYETGTEIGEAFASAFNDPTAVWVMFAIKSELLSPYNVICPSLQPI